MELDQAIEILKKAVKFSAVEDQKHLDLSVIPADEKPKYQEALMVSQLAIKAGKITKDEFMRRVHLDH